MEELRSLLEHKEEFEMKDYLKQVTYHEGHLKSSLFFKIKIPVIFLNCIKDRALAQTN
jgi:hypothetical protein